MLEKQQFTPAEVAHEKAQVSLEITFEHIKRQASLEQRNYLFALYAAIVTSEDAYPFEETLSEVFQTWCQSGRIVHTELFNDLESDFPDIYSILEKWFKRAQPFFSATGQDGSMVPFKRYLQYS